MTPLTRTLCVVATSALLAACAGMKDDVPPTAFRLVSLGTPAFGMLSKKNAGSNRAVPTCTGENVSPPLAWSNAPEKTRSFVILIDDQSGMDGLGVSHWVAYGIPASVTALAEGEASRESPNYVGGRNVYGAPRYAGPCPRFGGAPQHYVFTLIATDLEPGALPAGLSKPDVLAAIKGHNLRATSLVLRYAQ